MKSGVLNQLQYSAYNLLNISANLINQCYQPINRCSYNTQALILGELPRREGLQWGRHDPADLAFLKNMMELFNKQERTVARMELKGSFV
jgi:hypothetical protein